MTCLYCRSPITDDVPQVVLELSAKVDEHAKKRKGVRLIFGATACMIAWLRDQGQLPAELPPPMSLDEALDSAVSKKEPN